MCRSPRYYSLDAWRGVACLMIVALHAWPDPYFAREALRAGVPMFFVISGYCISATAESTIRKKDGVGRYFLRRFRRIYPPFWIFLILVSCFVLTPVGAVIVDGRAVHDPRELPATAWLGNFTLTETWLSTQLGRDPLFVTGHAWTLCYEEQFYAIVGALLLLCPKRFFMGCLGVTALTLALYPLLPRLGVSIRGSFLDLAWLAFAAGVWVYHHRVHATGIPRMLLWALPVAGAAFAFRHPDRPDWFLVPAFGFALVLAALAPWDELITRITRPLRWCGLMCYSLYLVHLPVTFWLVSTLREHGPVVTVPACIAASLAIAAAFHFAVERRFLNQRV
jgi:peptidoglycan/LPS O-acetylase OafA/YrhL